MALDAFAEAEKAAREAHVKAANGGDDFRLRVEHAQVTTPAQIAQFKPLKVIASMQPNHLLTDMRWARPVGAAAGGDFLCMARVPE